MFNLACLCCTEILGNCNIKSFAENQKTKHLLIGIFAYIAMIYFLIRIFKSNKSMLHVNVMWQMSVVILGTLIAYFFMGDRFKHPMQMLGILFAILSVYFINYS
jgi:multidrug transporter EmrE-like cation transporter